MTEVRQWRRCSACKEPIPFSATYWVCSVTTCNRARTALAFCSVECWEVHLPTANHREAWAIERTAPATSDTPDPASAAKEARTGRRRLVRPGGSSPSPVPDEVLIVASRLKEYIRARSGFSTSDRVLIPLSEIVRRVCDQAMENAAREGRRTVLERDVPDA